ncbi:MAG: hypothetical protein D6731_00125 [Planctomycetota bacterium]|nr:MAG: hypothetical protein D6731_00125 [Planctomycetota bacterium]
MTDDDLPLDALPTAANPRWAVAVALVVALAAVGASCRAGSTPRAAPESSPGAPPKPVGPDDASHGAPNPEAPERPPPPTAIRDYFVDPDLRAGAAEDQAPDASGDAGTPRPADPSPKPEEAEAGAAEAPPRPHAAEGAEPADASLIARGRELFALHCTACHGPQGQGDMGPNLCDDYFLHGHRPADVARIIAEGNPKAGMIAWKAVLRPDDLRAVTAFVLRLRGTNPPYPKPPEGTHAPGRASGRP